MSTGVLKYFSGPGKPAGMGQKRSSEARRRGPDLDAPLNRPGPETPGFVIPRRKRVRLGQIDAEQRNEMLRDFYELAKMGATDFEIACAFDVDIVQVHRWRHADPEFAKAMDGGKEVYDARVARALFHRAVGYSYKAEKIFQQDGKIIRAPYIEHVPPDVDAAKNWLYNRSDEWAGLKEFRVRTPDIGEAQDPKKIAMAMLAAIAEAAVEQTAALPATAPVETDE